MSVNIGTTSLVLGAIVTGLLVTAVLLRPPPPQAHPFLLGRQSIASTTRFPGESSTYTNSSSGGLRAALRPDKKIKALNDILQPSLTRFEGGARGTWIQGGEKLVTVVMELRAGLLGALGAGEGTVAVLVEDPTDALLITLALALTPHKPLVVSPGSKLPAATPVTAIVQSSTLFSAAQQLSTSPNAKWISLGAPGEKSAVAEDLLASGKALFAEAPAVEEALPSEVALTIVSEGISLAISHLNLTASLIGWLSLFPGAPHPTRPSINDTILSFHHPSTPYGLGLALLAIHSSASLSLPALPADLTHEGLSPILLNPASAPPTLIFGPTSTLATPLYKTLLQDMLGDSAFIIRYARDAKLRLLREGTVSQSTWWDKLLFAHLRNNTGLKHTRLLVLEGPLEQNRSEFFRMALGIPVVSTLGHAFLLAPLSAGMMYDFQRLPPPQLDGGEVTGKEKGSVGPPVAGVEVKLRGDEKEISAGRVRGELLVRTPVLPLPHTLPQSLLSRDEVLPSLPPYPGRPAVDQGDSSIKWLRTGLKAEMGKEGALWFD